MGGGEGGVGGEGAGDGDGVDVGECVFSPLSTYSSHTLSPVSPRVNLAGSSSHSIGLLDSLSLHSDPIEVFLPDNANDSALHDLLTETVVVDPVTPTPEEVWAIREVQMLDGVDPNPNPISPRSPRTHSASPHTHAM